MRIDRDGLERVLEAQKELDKAIFKGAGLKEGTFPLNHITLAYNVELGELAQEWKGFKYWKKTKGEVNKDRLLEEYADCLHFASSLTNHYLSESEGARRFFDIFLSTIGLDDLLSNIETKEDSEAIEYSFLKCFGNYRYFEYGAMILTDTLYLGGELGFTWKEIEEAYFKKNNINWERLAGGY